MSFLEFRGFLVGAVLVLGGIGAVTAQQAGQEIVYPSAAFAKLDTFEGLNLEDADKLFQKRDFKGAYAAYKAYSFEFSKSKSLPYVLLRMGRCLHYLDKRFEAIKGYQDVVDYFPDDVVYSAAALYYIGECHGQNGDDNKKLAVWARLVKDDDYVNQPNSGTALVFLGNAMDKLGKFEEATEYRWRTAVFFLQSNPGAAQAARAAVAYHYIVRRPNHEKLKAFYVAANGFEGRGDNTGKPQEDGRYWNAVFNNVMVAQENREDAARYWGGAFGDLFPKDDGLRIRLFELQLVYEKDMDAWVARMNKQFESQPVTLARVIGWVPSWAREPKRQLEFALKHGGPLMAAAPLAERIQMLQALRAEVRASFYEKYVQPTVAGLKREEKISLMWALRHPLGLNNEAQSVMRSVSLDGMSDEGIQGYASFAALYLGEEDVIRILARMKDSMNATKARFDYYLARTDRNRPFQEKALAEIPTLKKEPKYAGPGLLWTEADLQRGLGRLEEAIKAYQAANRQPDTTWAVTDCLVALKRYPEAIRNVQGLESVGGAVAAQACFRVADILRVSGDKGKEVEQLRLVLRRYPKSGEASAAHQRLESYGVKVIGGEAKAEE
jgi:tetratricopeptide (TPR) repeat protein